MSASQALLALDQGTTSTRAILFAEDGSILDVAQQAFPQSYPADGWVEHAPEDLWDTARAVCRAVLARAQLPVAALGITNQRETTLIWDRATGEPIYPAIVWQDRRTAGHCEQLRAAGHEHLFTTRTGLLLDPYFSGTKVAWILDHVDGARRRAERGELAFGTVDCFLIWRLTGGRVHATDATNASRTLLFDIHRQDWDDELLALLEVPRALLPEVRDSAADFGVTDPETIGQALRIGGVAGDQQAATVGQACFLPGMVKSTYGTGCFALMNTGQQATASANRLLTTVAYRLEGRTTYALEGSIFIAGAAVQWLRDELKLIGHASETEALAAGLSDNGGVYLVPAFTGLGAPYWDPHARGTLTGLTRDSGVAHLVRAALEAVCYQTCDLTAAMAADLGRGLGAVRVDGGMVGNAWLLQFLADVTGVPVERPGVAETTALGAAYLAGLNAGLYADLAQLAERWACDRRFEPSLAAPAREALLRGWQAAVAKARTAA